MGGAADTFPGGANVVPCDSGVGLAAGLDAVHSFLRADGQPRNGSKIGAVEATARDVRKVVWVRAIDLGVLGELGNDGGVSVGESAFVLCAVLADGAAQYSQACFEPGVLTSIRRSPSRCIGW